MVTINRKFKQLQIYINFLIILCGFLDSVTDINVKLDCFIYVCESH